MTADSTRARDRWHGWVWLVVAMVSPVFLIGTHAAFLSRPQQFLVALAFGTGGLMLWILEAHRGTAGQEARRIDRPVTLAYIALMVVVASIAIVWEPVGPPAWFVVVSLLPSVPCAVGAWRILR